MNIVLITAQFPNFDNPDVIYATPFLYKYAKEWVKAGHSVDVFHLTRVYPNFFTNLARILAKFGNHALEKYIINPEAQNDKEYSHDGIRIHRMTYKKYVPHGASPKYEINRLSNIISKQLSKIEMPDLIIGDFFDPVIAIIHNGLSFKGCPIGQTVHVSDFPMFKQNNVRKNIDKIDFWLLRSQSQELTLNKYVPSSETLLMYSGITNEFIENVPQYRTGARRLLYVGTLHKFKGIDTILDALAIIKNKGFILKLVGKGSDEAYFRKRVEELDLSDCVEFIGKVPHAEVFRYMNESDIQIMISHETFGMVYVEAMSQGCIPIGAKNEGIDGVVINGKNGFLTELGDSKALAELLVRLSDSSSEYIENISKSAYETACRMTDEQLASRLLVDLLQRGYIHG